MSSINFNFQDNTYIPIPGMYRFYFASLLHDLFCFSLQLSEYNDENNNWICNCFDKNHYIQYGNRKNVSRMEIKTALNGSLQDIYLYHENEKYDSFHLELNTAIHIGSDPIKLAARIHAQCEIFCYIEEKNRKWIADIIDNGIAIGVFDVHSKYNHWKILSERLRKENDGPVVLSSSVTDSFPNILLSDMSDLYLHAEEEDKYNIYDKYYDIPSADRFSMGMDHLRSQGHKLLELKPENWNSMYFGSHNMNGFMFRKMVQSKNQSDG